MAFGEEFAGMTDREILIEIVGEMKALQKTVESRPPCPSPMCQTHEAKLTSFDTRLTAIEKAHETETEEKKETRKTWTDYAMQASFLVLGSLITIFFTALFL